MIPKKLNELSISEANKLLVNKEVSSLDIVEACLKEVDLRNNGLNAYLEIFDDVRDEAKRADKARAEGAGEELLGIPLAIKDNILIKGKHASASSKILENYKATYDATAIARLKKSGAIFIGRTNMDEFAMGGSTENSAYGITRNPIDESRVPGGSSGGSASAVAAHMALGALGTDTGGSVRQPASFCGIVALKPTYGAISRSGIIAMGSSLDQVGPMTKSVTDTEMLFNSMKGKDVLDSTSIDTEVRSSGKTIGVPWHFLKEGLDAGVESNFRSALTKLESLGYTIKEIDLKLVKYSLPVYYIIMPAESSTNLARFDGVRFGKRVNGGNLLETYMNSRALFGPEVRRRILLGTYVLSAGYFDAYYYKAVSVREAIKNEFKEVFKDVDIIATPTAPTPAFKIGEKTSDPLSMYLEDIFTTPANIAGIPALSVPMGEVEVDNKQLPVGIQFMACEGGESTLFKIGKEFLEEVQ